VLRGIQHPAFEITTLCNWRGVHLGTYRRWNPLPDLRGRWDVESVHDDYEGFRVIMRLEPFVNRRWRFWFPRCLLYQVANESFRLSGSNETGNIFEGPHGHFFTVEGSSLVADFHRSSAGAYEAWDIKHYAMYSEQCADVLSVHAPIIEELPTGQTIA
jgi:hypothetical protein